MQKSLLTIADFQSRLAEGDRWIELVAGRLHRFEQPDELHGNVVRNLSGALARSQRKLPVCYAAFELGLVVSKNPDTVLAPAIACFSLGDHFAALDGLVTETRPAWVIEIASTGDRREGVAQRVAEYLDWGVPEVWVVDSVSRHLHQFTGGRGGRMWKEVDTLPATTLTPNLNLDVAALFADPVWMNDALPRSPDVP